MRRAVLPQDAAVRRVIGAVLLLASLAACASGVPADEWAGRVCGALAPWRAQISDLNAQAQRQMSATSTPEQTRDNLLTLLTGAEAASETARAAVAAAGTPDVDGGEKVAHQFTASLEGTRDAYARARKDLQALPTGDAAAFYDGVVAVMSALTAEYTKSGVDTGRVESPQLRRAFDGTEQCR
jgi:hypothetical protein